MKRIILSVLILITTSLFNNLNAAANYVSCDEFSIQVEGEELLEIEGNNVDSTYKLKVIDGPSDVGEYSWSVVGIGAGGDITITGPQDSSECNVQFTAEGTYHITCYLKYDANIILEFLGIDDDYECEAKIEVVVGRKVSENSKDDDACKFTLTQPVFSEIEIQSAINSGVTTSVSPLLKGIEDYIKSDIDGEFEGKPDDHTADLVWYEKAWAVTKNNISSVVDGAAQEVYAYALVKLNDFASKKEEYCNAVGSTIYDTLSNVEWTQSEGKFEGTYFYLNGARDPATGFGWEGISASLTHGGNYTASGSFEVGISLAGNDIKISVEGAYEGNVLVDGALVTGTSTTPTANVQVQAKYKEVTSFGITGDIAVISLGIAAQTPQTTTNLELVKKSITANGTVN